MFDRQAARRFVLENARPLDRAVYAYSFEGGPRAAVVAELAKFQNPDGGFGHALEADNWNPRSNPIATNDAIITLQRTGALAEAPEMVSGIVRYLASHDSFDEGRRRWLFAIESNRDYPHAIWWEKKGDGVEDFNPSVSLAAFMVCFGERTPLYEDILREAWAFLRATPVLAGDPLKCYLLAHALLKAHGVADIVDLEALGALLVERLDAAVCRDTEKYGVEYAPTPSDFFAGQYGEFVSPDMRGLIAAELAAFPRLQLEDGGFDISWQWHTPYPEEFRQARAWWRARITTDKLLFAEEYGIQ